MGDRYNQIYAFILYSVALGAALGVLYDVFRIIRMAVTVPGIISSEHRGEKPKRRFTVNIIVFICDILFFMISACICAIFIFHANNGNIRWIALAGSLIGFIIYYNTVGRLVTMISGFVIRGVYFIIRFVIYRLFFPLCRLIAGMLRGAVRRIGRLDRFLYTKRVIHSVVSCAGKGYGIIKK